jgi:hypothetical protein
LRNIQTFGKFRAPFGHQHLNYTHSHPNIVQIYGAASSCGIHATLFHDGAVFYLECGFHLHLTFVLDLVPFQQYVDTYRYSHFATVYIWSCGVRVCCNPFIKSDPAKGSGLICRKIFSIIGVPDTRAGSKRPCVFHISTAFG